MKITVDGEAGRFEKAYKEDLARIKRAAKDTITQAGARMLREGRADIAAAGFGGDWVRGLKVAVYPQGTKTSVNSAAYVTHKLGYASVFEHGAEIRGRPLLWVPLPGTPKSISGQPTTAKLYSRHVGKMFLIRGPSGKPVLARREGKRLIPLFVGLDAVSIRKRFHIGEIADRIRGDLPQMFEQNINSQI
jgi:hypothetical protein